MNIHHYYSILSLLTKFEPTTEKERKKGKRESAASIFPLVPYKNTRNLNVTRDACTKVVYVTK